MLYLYPSVFSCDVPRDNFFLCSLMRNTDTHCRGREEDQPRRGSRGHRHGVQGQGRRRAVRARPEEGRQAVHDSLLQCSARYDTQRSSAYPLVVPSSLRFAFIFDPCFSAFLLEIPQLKPIHGPIFRLNLLRTSKSIFFTNMLTSLRFSEPF